MWWVGGNARCGTSMMFEALMASGMVGAWDIERDKAIENLSKPGEPINDKLYEFKFGYPFKYDFRRTYEGMMVKLVGEALIAKAYEGDKVVFMKRDWAEVRASYSRVQGAEFNISRRDYLEYNDRIVEQLERLGVEVFKVWFQGVISGPEMWFRGLRDNGWPIDVDKACAVIDPGKVHFMKVGNHVRRVEGARRAYA